MKQKKIKYHGNFVSKTEAETVATKHKGEVTARTLNGKPRYFVTSKEDS